ncbi:MAG: hypothetical protein QNJ98_13850, partial [Planctomycetota bacterium]|nr:hypothetical protein [Planctomycetota bacterium]
MSFTVQCVCGKAIKAREDQIGRTGRCPGCGQIIRIEGPTPPPSTDAQRYFARAPGADLQGPYELHQLQSWFLAGQLDTNLEFSTDGRTWLTAAQIPGLTHAAPPPAPPRAPTPSPQASAPTPHRRPASRAAPAHAHRRAAPRSARSGQNPPWLIPAAAGGLLLAVVLIIAMPSGSDPDPEPTRKASTPRAKPQPATQTPTIEPTPLESTGKPKRKAPKVDHPSWEAAEA